MTGRLARWLLTHRPATSIARLVEKVRREIAAEEFAESLDTLPGVHVQSLASWGVHDDPLAQPPTNSEFGRLRQILNGSSPSDLPRSR